MMKIVSLSTDRKLFVPGSSVSKRMIEYASVLGELHIIVFAQYKLGFAATQIAPNVWVYPSNSANKLWYMIDAYRIAKGILSTVYFGQTVITTQDAFETGMVGVFLKKIFKVPLQIQIHTDAWNSYFRYHTLRNWLQVSFIAPFVIRRATGVRVVSDKIGRDVIIHTKIAFKKVFVLPVFVDVASYANAPVTRDLRAVYKDRAPLVLMASRLTTEKNVLLALKAFRRFVKRYPQALLVIVGDGPELNRLTRYVRFHHLQHSVAFESWQKDMASYMRTADIFLNTSHYEGYGMTLVEAGATGAALVTTSVGIGQDILVDGRNALICPPGSEDCIYSKLMILAENNHMRKALGDELYKSITAIALTKDEYVVRMKKGYDILFDEPV